MLQAAFRQLCRSPDTTGLTRGALLHGRFAWTAEEAAKRWRPGQPVIRLMDGQKSLWTAADACLEELYQKMLAHDSTQQFEDIVDIIHVSQYVWRGAKVLLPSSRAARSVCGRSAAAYFARGDVVGSGYRHAADGDAAGPDGRAAQEMTTVCNYLANNAERMRYHEYLQAGYPIASGVIEGPADTHHQRPHGTGRHALDTTGRRSDAQRPSRLRLERVGRVPQLATIGKQKNKPPERRPGGKLHWIQSMKPRGRTVTPRWSRHSAWEGARLVGLTPCGRATGDVLNVNEPHRIELRELLFLGGVFPPDEE